MVQILPINSIAEQRHIRNNDLRVRYILKRAALILSLMLAFFGTVIYFGRESFEIRKYLKYVKEQDHDVSSLASPRIIDQGTDEIGFDDNIEDDDERKDELEEEEANGEEEYEGGETPSQEHIELDQQTRTSYKIIQNLEFNNTFDYYKCDEIERNNTSSLFSQHAILDFHAQITTSLKVLIMGDSVAIQYGQAFQEAAGASHNNRKVLRYAWGLHEGIHVAGVRGGGAIGGWRITGMFRQEQMNNDKDMPNSPGGGWMEYDVRKIKRALAAVSRTQVAEEPSSFCDIQEATATRRSIPVQPASEFEDTGVGCPEENFDVVVHEFPFSWMKKPITDWFTYEKIDEAVQLSGQQFGAKVVIVQTTPVQNNVVDMVSELKAVNDAIFNYSSTYDSNLIKENNDESGKDVKEVVETVLVMDLAKFSYELFTQNAVSLGLMTYDTEAIQEAFGDNSITELLNPLITRRTKCCNQEFPQIIGYTCAEVSSQNSDPEDCIKTRYSRDGMHWCMDEVGGRINAALACLLKCVDQENKSRDLRSCEKRCNDQYMSLNPIHFPISESE